jgi:hypothetical protein
MVSCGINTHVVAEETARFGAARCALYRRGVHASLSHLRGTDPSGYGVAHAESVAS